jgi:hypothetical protein
MIRDEGRIEYTENCEGGQLRKMLDQNTGRKWRNWSPNNLTLSQIIERTGAFAATGHRILPPQLRRPKPERLEPCSYSVYLFGTTRHGGEVQKSIPGKKLGTIHSLTRCCTTGRVATSGALYTVPRHVIFDVLFSTLKLRDHFIFATAISRTARSIHFACYGASETKSQRSSYSFSLRGQHSITWELAFS